MSNQNRRTQLSPGPAPAATSHSPGELPPPVDPTLPPVTPEAPPVAAPAPQVAAAAVPPQTAQAQAQPQPVVSLHDMILQTIDARRMAGQQFYLVVIPANDVLRIEEFPSIVQLIERIQQLLETETHLLPFMGYKLGISKGPHRFLTGYFGTFPLFAFPDEKAIELEEDGFVGKHVEAFVAPLTPTPAIADQSAEAELSGDADDDDTPALPFMSAEAGQPTHAP